MKKNALIVYLIVANCLILILGIWLRQKPEQVRSAATPQEVVQSASEEMASEPERKQIADSVLAPTNSVSSSNNMVEIVTFRLQPRLSTSQNKPQ